MLRAAMHGLLLLLAACGARAPAPEPPLAAAGLAQQLREQHRAQAHAWPQTREEAAQLCAHPQVLLAGSRAPAPPLAEDVAARLRLHVETGGRLLLLGSAAAYAHRLGVEPTAPDRNEQLRWGYDDRTLLGTLELALQFEPDAAAPAAGLEPGAAIAGGAAPVLALVGWRERTPERGRVLARLAERRDGAGIVLPDGVLVRWQPGEGELVALGVLPQPERWPAAARLLRNLLDLRDLGFAIAPEPARHEPAALPPLDVRVFPGRHPAPLWGFCTTANEGRAARTPIAPDQLAREAIAAPARAGASLALFHLQDGELGFPLAWPTTDPIARPHGFRAHVQWPSWGWPTLGQLAAAAHTRGLAAMLRIAPAPVHGGQPVEQLAACKWLARCGLDVRALGPAALDGLLLPPGLAALEFLPSLLAPYQPQHLLFAGEPAGAVTGVLDMQSGRPRGLPWSGRSDRWRDTAHDDALPVALLDADLHASGAYPDWLLLQVQDFVRRREGEAALLWRGVAPDQLPEDLMPYVLGSSLAPLDGAFALRLLATGRDGWCDLLARRLPAAPAGFGPESELPAATAVLQNNHFRLHGSGGPLWFDPGGRARLRRDDAACVPIAASFLQTRIRGVRPRPEMAQIAAIDFTGGRPREAGDYGQVVQVRGEERGAGRTPARLQRGAVPHWPRRVEFEFTAPAGAYELELGLRGLDGPGIVELWAHGERTQLVAFQLGGDRQRIAFDAIESGSQQLALEVVEGGAVALDVCRVQRSGDLARVARILEPGGHRAVLEERTSSSAFRETARWTTHADLPGLLWEVEVLGCDRGLQVQRELQLAGYTRLLRAHEAADALASPFVLQAEDPRLPPLAVLPLALPANLRVAFTPERLVLTGSPQSKERLAIGFLWLRDQSLDHWESLLPWWREILTPPVLELGEAGRAQFAAKLPFAAPRVVRVLSPARDAYLVREGTHWLTRGAQPAAAGGDWVRFYTPAEADAELCTGAARAASIRPGPGAAHLLALAAPDAGSVRASRLTPDPLLVPSVQFPTAFDRVRIDGEPWDWFDGPLVFLPGGRESCRIETLRGEPPRARLARTDADVRTCRYDAQQALLEIFTRARDGRTEGALHTAWIVGPEPVALDGCERIDAAELRHPPDEAQALASRGFLVRFAPGLVRIRFAR